jgi:hemerythrin-like domain-containing protein
MSIIDTLTREHHLIRDYTDKIQVAAEVYGWGEQPPLEFFELAIKFSDTFIDQYHHVKEEEILFPRLAASMNGELDEHLKALQNQHKTARVAVMELKRCLKGYFNGDRTQSSIFWRNLGTYTSFLRAHLNRENHIFLPWIERKLSESERKDLERQFKIEENKLGKKFLATCKAMLDKMTQILEDHYGNRYRYLLDSVASKRTNYIAA